MQATAPYPRRFEEYLPELRATSGRAHSAKRKAVAALFGISDSTLSRWCQAAGVSRWQRRDRGARRIDVTDDVLRQLFALQYSSKSLKHGPIMTAKDVIDIAERNGIIDPDSVTPAYYNAWLRAQGISRTEVETPEPHVDLISLGPNHVHQADFSLAVNWKVENNKVIYEHLVYKNKLPAAGVPRIWRFALVDHATGYFFPRYAIAPGEDIVMFLEGLYYGWSEKTVNGCSIQHQYPFRGVPRILMVDRGPAMRSKITADLLSRLGVTLNICEGSRSKGAVESLMWWWEQRFESRFRLQPLTSIEELNHEAWGFAAWMCSQETHSRTRATRRGLWEFHLNRKPETQLRMMNIDLQTFQRIATTEPQKCRVSGSGVIAFKAKKYRVPTELIEHGYVAVQYSPFDYPQITVRAFDDANAPVFLCEPIELDEFGFPTDGVVIGSEYKSHKHTERKRMAAGAEQWLGDYQKQGAAIQTRGYHLERVEATGVRSNETDMAVEQQPAAIYSRIRAREEVVARVGRPLESAERNLMARFGEQVSEAEIDAAVAAIAQGVSAPVIAFRAAQ